MICAEEMLRGNGMSQLPKKRGRPSAWDKFCRAQGDLFPNEKQAAELLRLPSFRLAATCVVLLGAARPTPAASVASEDVGPGAPLGKSIRDLPPNGSSDGE